MTRDSRYELLEPLATGRVIAKNRFFHLPVALMADAVHEHGALAAGTMPS